MEGIWEKVSIFARQAKRMSANEALFPSPGWECMYCQCDIKNVEKKNANRNVFYLIGCIC